MLIPSCLALYLYGHQGNAETFLAPTRGIPGIHNTHGKIWLLPTLDPGISLKRKRVIIDQEIVVIRTWVGFGQYFYKRPSSICKVDRACGELFYRLFHLHFQVETSSISLSYCMGHVKQETHGDPSGLVLSPVLIQRGNQVKKFLGHGGCSDKNIPFPRDLYLRLAGGLFLLLEVLADIPLRPEENRL